MKHRTSQYNLVLQGPDDAIGIFNTLTGALTLLDASEWATVSEAFTLPGTTVGLTSPLLESLAAQGHLVGADSDERARVLDRKRAGIVDPNRLDVVLMPTLDCDFRCIYCYEEHRPSRMSPETVTAITMYFEREVPKYKGVMLHWYGGEPLLQRETVIDLTHRFVDIAEAAGVITTIQMTTNGYNLDAETCRALVDAGLREFQVTIDGTREHHNALRPHRTGCGTFDRVLANTKQLLHTDPEVQVAVRVNFNHTNADGIEGLLGEFDAELRPRIRFVFEPIFGGCDVRARTNIEDAAISGIIKALHKKAFAAGYASAVSGVHAGKLVYCYAERESQLIVGPDAHIYKCGVGHFEESDAVGLLRADGTIERFGTWELWTGEPALEESCLDCVYVPLCMGGCRKERASSGTGGDTCALVPQNVSSVLKMIALEGDNGLAPLLGLGASIEPGGTS